MIKFLDLAAQYHRIKPEIDAAIAWVLEQSTFIGGPPVSDFERSFADFQQASHCIGVANATDGLEIAIEALDLPAQSEVIVPANSFIASAEAVTRSGHRVVFADMDPAHYGIDIADLARRITARTKAVIAVHLYGLPCDVSGLRALCDLHGLRLIEDAAQAHGAEIAGRRVGALGDIGVFSFYPGKNLGAYGDAGAIVTNDEPLARRCRMIANHGRIAKYDHEFEGRNSRLDSIQAAILSVKLRHLDAWIDRRNVLASRYLTGLRDIPDLVLPSSRPNVRHAYHLFVVRTARREALAAALAAQGIQTGIHYPIALPKLAAYAYLGQATEPMNANALDVQLLSLPLGEHLSEDDVDEVIGAVRQFFSTAS